MIEEKGAAPDPERVPGEGDAPAVTAREAAAGSALGPGSDSQVPPRWRRRQTLVNRELQLRFTSVLLLQMTAVMLAITTFAYRESERAMDLVVRHLDDQPLTTHQLHVANQAFLFKVILVVGLTAIVQILFGVYSSHKLAGPVLKLTHVLRDATEGDFSGRVTFRRDDHLDGLAHAMNRALVTLSTEQAARRAAVAQVESVLAALRGAPPSRDASGEVQALRARLAEIAGVELEATTTVGS